MQDFPCALNFGAQLAGPLDILVATPGFDFARRLHREPRDQAVQNLQPRDCGGPDLAA
jgi:hypothetical protein